MLPEEEKNEIMKKILFIDRDGTLIKEPPVTFQIDKLEVFEFVPGVIRYLGAIARETDYELVMVTNQDGLGTNSYPESTFQPLQDLMMRTLASEGIHFSAVHIDRSFPHENLPTRKPGTAMLTKYLNGDFDLRNSFVIGDRLTDVLLAENLGTQSIFLKNYDDPASFIEKISCLAESWMDIYNFLRLPVRETIHSRKTSETEVTIKLGLEGSGKYSIKTGLNFFDHMLEQLARHGQLNLEILAKGDLHIDEHHTIEDVGITLGEAFALALGDKRGIERYGFSLPMDDCLAQVSLDLGGRSWLVWEVEFRRERIGDVPTEMFHHFFKSFCDSARCNLNVKAEGENEHHKIESIFKAFAKSLRAAVKRNPDNLSLPSTKGML